MSDIEIEIDGKKCQAKPNAMVIQVADEAGIYIPRFCYHKHLSIAANCRMCLVEVEKAPKPMPACATPVMPGMKVFTRSTKAMAAQKAVMEFLLINHPLDCPICDQGGECELQDLSMGYGSSRSAYLEGKRSVKDQDLGPLVATDMTRCILCTRCVRFGDEVAGLKELGVVNRGEGDRIEVANNQPLYSEISGNIIDLCPVGALTSKPFRFTARAWELEQRPSIAAHDCLGSNINVHTRNGTVMRVVPRENNAINFAWLSDRDRFSYQGLYHADRLTQPLIRVAGKLQATDWETALNFAVGQLQKTLSAQGVEQLGALASPSSTTEEFYLLQKLMRMIGSHHIDHRLRQVDLSDQDICPTSTATYAELDDADAILLVGSHIQKEQPIAAVRVRKAVLAGATAFAVNMLDYDFHFSVTEKIIVAPDEFSLTLAQIAKALGVKDETLVDVEINPSAMSIAKQLSTKKNIKIVVGALAFNHPQARMIRHLVRLIAHQLPATKIIFMTEGSNAAGAWLAGAVPKAKGLNAQSMLEAKLKAYILLNVEPDLDCANPVAAVAALQSAECVIALSVFNNPILEQCAQVIFPVAPHTETAGSFINAAGEWQAFTGVATAFGESRPAWKVLRVLANWLQLAEFEYQSAEEITKEAKQLTMLTGDEPSLFRKFAKTTQDALSLMRIAEFPLYSGDPLVRRAEALQATQFIIEGESAAVRVHPETAKKLMCTEGQLVDVIQATHRVRLPLYCDERVPLRGALIAHGLSATSGLSALFGSIQIVKVETV